MLLVRDLPSRKQVSERYDDDDEDSGGGDDNFQVSIKPYSYLVNNHISTAG